jgi:hypothetical protein
MGEQKKKLTKQTESFEKKLKSSMSTEKIERQLEKLKLEKTLVKLKSMKKVGGMKVVTEEGGSVDAHCNNANNILTAARQQHQQQQFLEEIGQSMSSASSFSYDGKEGEHEDDGAESIMSDQIRPSQHPTSIRKLPSSIHPPPPPPASMRTPPSPVSRHSFGGDWTPEWTPGADSVGGGGRGGASENIRMGSDSNQFCDREYNDDIDDCI